MKTPIVGSMVNGVSVIERESRDSLLIDVNDAEENNFEMLYYSDVRAAHVNVKRIFWCHLICTSFSRGSNTKYNHADNNGIYAINRR